MALQISESFESRNGTNGRDGSDELIAQIWGDPVADNAENEVVIVAFAMTKFPLVTNLGNVFANLKRRHTGVPGRWEVIGQYKSPTEHRQTNDAAFSFSTGGGTQHITHSRKTVARFGAGDDDPDASVDPAGTDSSPNFMQGINVGDDGPTGVDIGVASFDFKTTFYIAPANMSAGYISQCKSLTDCVNKNAVSINVDGVILNFDPGELKLNGVEGSKRHGISDFEFSASWSAIPNESNLTIPGISGNITKNGWDYLWVYSKMQKDETSGQTIHQPFAAYVEQLYDYQDLNPIVQPSSFGQSNTQPWTAINPTAGGSI